LTCNRVPMLIASLSIFASAASAAAERRPNIVLIMTDDQGFGDLGAHGNPKIKTPNLDKFAGESVWLKNFYVSPVCAPTRASLLTGRYNYRTGVVDTYLGRALMYPDEVTLAEVLSGAGYRTGIFGKWHLGDNAPMRPIDQGFGESLVIKGGGIGQAADPPGGSSYFDPILQHNGSAERYKGYCSDVFASAAIDFLKSGSDRPFFAYLAFNCPHDPLEVPESELEPYKAMDLTLSSFPQLGQPIPREWASPPETVARVYAMVSNIDKNIGRVLKALDDRKLAADTIVIFLTDNGAAQVRFNAGLRGWKGSVFDGGIRVPCYLRWPEHFPGRLVVENIAAHIDLMPTLLDACGISPPEGLKLDGKSLLPLITGKQTAGLPDRTLTAATSLRSGARLPRGRRYTSSCVASQFREPSRRRSSFLTWSMTHSSLKTSPLGTASRCPRCTRTTSRGSRMSRRPAVSTLRRSSWGAHAKTPRS
jgi:arylsulfatase A-like enzyme